MEEEFDSASYNTPRLVDKLATGVIITTSFVDSNFTSTTPQARLSELDVHLRHHIDAGSTREGDIRDILEIVEQYKGPRSNSIGLDEIGVGLVIKPMKEGVQYFKNSIKEHEKKEEKAKKIKNFNIKHLIKQLTTKHNVFKTN